MALPLFPTLPGLQYPVKRAPLWNTIKQESASGAPTRIPTYAYPRYKYELDIEFLRDSIALPELQTLRGFINSVNGAAGVFAFLDPDDWNPSLSAGVNNIFPFSVPTANWDVIGATVGVDALTDPLGGGTGSYVVEDTSTGFHVAYGNFGRLLPQFNYTASCYFHAGTRTQAALRFLNGGGGGSGSYVGFDLSSGSVLFAVPGTGETILNSGISYVGGGWYRGWMTLNSTYTGGLAEAYLCAFALSSSLFVYTGTGGNAIGVWGMQLEAYPVPETPTGPAAYVPTTTGGALFGTGDGSTKSFQLVRTLGGFAEPVFTPGAAAIFLNGVPQTSGLTIANGIVTFTSAPTSGYALTWAGDYEWPCQFDDDSIEIDKFLLGYWKAPKLAFTTWHP